MSRSRPSRWLLGLIPMAFIAAPYFQGSSGQFERDSQDQSRSLSEDRSASFAELLFDGQRSFVSGSVGTGFQHAAAIGVVQGVWSVDSLGGNVMKVAASTPYVWWASREENVVKLKGLVPSKEYRRTVLGIVKANMAELKIDDRMKQADGAPAADLWLGAVSFALNQLGRLKNGGKARLENTTLTLSGEARSAADYREVKSALRSQLPRGLELKHDAVTPPLAKPFDWRAEFRNGALVLSGHVPSDTAREVVVKAAQKYFPGRSVSDRMSLGAGAPVGWEQAVTNVLAHLRRLDWGVATLTDTELAIEGKAVDSSTAADVKAKVRQGLPPIFQSEENILPDKGKPAPAKTKSGSGPSVERDFSNLLRHGRPEEKAGAANPG